MNNSSVLINEQLLEIFSWSFSHNTVGYFLSLFFAFNVAFGSLITKKLTNFKIHFSIIGIYTTIITIPLGICIVLASELSGYHVRDYSLIHEVAFIYDIVFFLLGSISGIFKLFIKINITLID